MKINRIIFALPCLALWACSDYKPVSEKNLAIDKSRPAACQVSNPDAPGGARRETLRCSAATVLAAPEAQKILSRGARIQVDGSPNKVLQNKVLIRASANANGNTDETTCRNAFIQAMRKAQKIAKKRGGHGIANIHGAAPHAGNGEFVCIVGTVRGRAEVYVDILP